MSNFESILCIVFTLLSVFGSHSQMAPASAGHTSLLELGTSKNYDYTSTILLNENVDSNKSVGYQISGSLDVSVVWKSASAQFIRFELMSPKLLIKSRKAPEPEGYVVHKSNLDSFKNSPFLVLWKSGIISKIYIDTKEDASLKNMKKGIASLFQFQLLDGKSEETDSSGTCNVKYHSIDPFNIFKTKTKCKAPIGVPFISQSDAILSTDILSTRKTAITLSKDLSNIEKIVSKETHSMSVTIKSDASNVVASTQNLISTEKKVKLQLFKSGDPDSVIKEFEKAAKIMTKVDTLNPEVTVQSCSKAECPSLPVLVKELRDSLQDSHLGTVRSANAFLRLLDAGRSASKDDLTKAFKGTKNKEILLQLCDLGGAINSIDSHDTIKKIINFEDDALFDAVERYLWALASGSHPKIEIIKDLYKTSQKPIENPKLAETIALTLATLVRKFRSLPGYGEHIIIQDVTNAITTDLEESKDEENKHKNLRALGNLLCPSTIPLLIHHALTGKSKTSVEAMKTIRAFHPKLWNEDVIDAAQRIYFQAGRKYDSSARTLAIDILFESSPKREILKELISSLLEWDNMFEVHQYLNQRLQQISAENSKFANMVNSIKNELKESFINYNVRAQRGLTTAFTRPFATNHAWNGTLVNIQEVFGGLLKRGIVDIAFSQVNHTTSVFTLGLFAGGLSSFVSSSTPPKDSNEAGEVEEEVPTAGMELSVLGSRIRPFVFFSGQGELMGHVWSGTASEKTPAFQALVMSHDHLEYISLQNGLVAQLQLHGAVSFDLSGQIQMSLWNRNAHSLVEQNAGVSLQGRTQVDTSFIKSQVGFNLGSEVKLNLISDLNFYSGVSLCMQLVQPDATLRHNVHKIERIIGSKHKLRKSIYRKITLPGRTYVLNQKNNDMCNIIFKE